MRVSTNRKIKPTATKILAVTLTFILNCYITNAQDTSFYSNGTVKEICYLNKDTLNCEWFEKDGSKIQLPNTVSYTNYLGPMLQNKVVDIIKISNPDIISEEELWRFSKLLKFEFRDMEEDQSFTIIVNDTISAYFISAMDWSDPKFFIGINDSTFLTVHYPPAIMTSPEVLAVTFQDYDKNGRTDIAYIIRYVTGTGPRGSWDRYDSVILLNTEDGFKERFFSDITTISGLKQKFQSEMNDRK